MRVILSVESGIRSGIKAGLAGLGVLALGLPFGTAQAQANLVVNGGFETFTTTPTSGVASASSQVAATGSTADGTATLAGWTNAGYAFVFTPGTSYTTGATNVEYAPTLCLWGPGTCGGNYANGFTATSPSGGNFIAVDGAYQPGALSQTINGLTVGSNYVLSFYWGAGQQQGAGYTAPTQDSWGVTFGGQTYNTPTINNAGQGFTPWMQQTFSFTATAASQTLSFLAAGAPSGTPPFALLDGVSLVLPEPASWGMLLGALGAVAVLRHATRRRTAAGTAA